MDLYLVRHTQVAVPVGTCYGHQDVRLAASFAREAAAVQLLLPALDDYPVVSSPSQRCLALARYLKPNASADDALRELNFGTWEGQLWNDIPRVELDPWADDFVGRAPPGGETFAALARRSSDALGRFAALGSPGVVCVTHAGVIRALLCRLLPWPLAGAFTWQVAYGSVTCLRLKRSYGEGTALALALDQVGYVNRHAGPLAP